MLRMFGFDDERSGLADEYALKSFKRYFGYALVNEVWHIQTIL